jgi:hypothetical protein
MPHAAAEFPEASPIKGGILAASWLVAMVTLAAVNMSAISSQLKQAKLEETAPQAATAAAVVSSPTSPQIPVSSIAPNASPAPIAASSPAPIAAASLAPIAAASPAPIAAASPAPIAAASPAPIAAASPAPIAAASPAPNASPAPIAAASPAAIAAAANSAGAANAATTATSEISDQAELDAIGKQLYAQIDQKWRTTPTFTESLTYRVKVKQNGDILQFDPTNKAAKDFVKETPLPVLQTPGGATAGAEKTAEFQVTFSPTNGGVFEVKSGK